MPVKPPKDKKPTSEKKSPDVYVPRVLPVRDLVARAGGDPKGCYSVHEDDQGEPYVRSGSSTMEYQTLISEVALPKEVEDGRRFCKDRADVRKIFPDEIRIKFDGISLMDDVWIQRRIINECEHSDYKTPAAEVYEAHVKQNPILAQWQPRPTNEPSGEEDKIARIVSGSSKVSMSNAAQFLGVTPRRVQQLRQEGKLKGGRGYVTAKSLQNYKARDPWADEIE